MSKERVITRNVKQCPPSNEIYNSMMSESVDNPYLVRVLIDGGPSFVDVKVSEMQKVSETIIFKGTAMNVTNIVGNKISNVQVTVSYAKVQHNNTLSFHIIEE